MSAVRRVEADGVVVVVGADAAEVGSAIREAAARGERVGALVGSPEDAEVLAALADMVEELYGVPDENS
jgi:hypothetical protein